MTNTRLARSATMLISVAVLTAMSPTLVAQDQDTLSPLFKGGYVAPLASYVLADNQLASNNGIGGSLALGYRQEFWALEISGLYASLSEKGQRDPSVAGASLGALVFPFIGLPQLYAVAAVGGVEVDKFNDTEAFNLGILELGIGHLFALGGERYEWAIRAEARYRIDRREADITDVPGQSVDAARHFDDVLISIGLQLPFGKKAPPAAPPPPAEVVPPIDPGGTSAP